MKNHKFAMNLKLFGHPAGGAADPGQAEPPSATTPPAAAPAGQAQPPAIDYSKIQTMLEGTLAAKEDVALKAYFKQQGLSQQEAEQAMGTFKQHKAAQQPDVGVLQMQAAQAQQAAQQAQVQSQATLKAVSLGMDAKTIPYLLKLADFSQVAGADGISDEAIEAALKKVIEDVPALKPQPGQSAGFVQVGASGQGGTTTAVDAELDKIFGVKR